MQKLELFFIDGILCKKCRHITRTVEIKVCYKFRVIPQEGNPNRFRGDADQPCNVILVNVQ